MESFRAAKRSAQILLTTNPRVHLDTFYSGFVETMKESYLAVKRSWVRSPSAPPSVFHIFPLKIRQISCFRFYHTAKKDFYSREECNIIA